MKLLYIFTSLPFLGFYSYAAIQSRRFRAVAGQPAGLSFIVFTGLIVKWLITMILFYTVPLDDKAHQIMAVLHIPFVIALLVCVFGWRNREGATYVGPAIFAAIGVILPLMSPVLISVIVRTLGEGDPVPHSQGLMIAIACVSTVINFGSFILLYKAIFGWRGYPRDLPGPAAASAKPAAPPSDEKDAVPVPDVPEPPGMFEERDFIPYICGVMLLGGIFVVPVIWGLLLDLSYEKSLFPSILSCGVFALSHSKKGHLLFGRFIFLNIYVFFTIMRSAAKYGSGGGKPMFLAGGMLGFIVMAGCGWAGIGVMRLIRRYTS